MASETTLRTIKRHITAINPLGQTVFDIKKPADDIPLNQYGHAGTKMSLLWATDRFPAKLDPKEDIASYDAFRQNPPSTTLPNGVIVRMVDIPPKYTSEMHRAIGMGYNTIIEGEAHLILDSGQRELLKPGDTVVHRMDNHAWQNESDTQWARLLAISLPVDGNVADGHCMWASSVPVSDELLHSDKSTDQS